MRGSVVFLAVFAVTSCSVGVNGAHFVRSGITGYGTGRGNGDAPGIEESAFGNGENDGRHIGKRSSLGRDAAFRLAPARRQQMIDPRAPFTKPILLPQFPIPIPPPPIEELPPPGMAGPILTPPLPETPWTPPPLVQPDNLQLRRAVPSALERELRSLTALKFLPLSEVKEAAVKIISNALANGHILPAILPKLSARRSFARRQDFYGSGFKNRRSRYSGSRRSYSPLRSEQTLPGPLIDDFVSAPLYKNARDTAPARSDAEENFRMEVRSAVVQYLVQLWDKISKWFKPGSNSGGGMGDLPPKEEIPVEGGKEVGPGLPEEHEVHTERPPEEYEDDVIIEPVTRPVDDGVEITHLSSEEDAPETAEDAIGEGGSEFDEDYSELSYFKPPAQTNWEIRHSTRVDDRSEDVASKIRDTAARKKSMRDNLNTVTDIFGRLADD